MELSGSRHEGKLDESFQIAEEFEVRGLRAGGGAVGGPGEFSFDYLDLDLEAIDAMILDEETPLNAHDHDGIGRLPGDRKSASIDNNISPDVDPRSAGEDKKYVDDEDYVDGIDDEQGVHNDEGHSFRPLDRNCSDKLLLGQNSRGALWAAYGNEYLQHNDIGASSTERVEQDHHLHLRRDSSERLVLEGDDVSLRSSTEDEPLRAQHTSPNQTCGESLSDDQNPNHTVVSDSSTKEVREKYSGSIGREDPWDYSDDYDDVDAEGEGAHDALSSPPSRNEESTGSVHTGSLSWHHSREDSDSVVLSAELHSEKLDLSSSIEDTIYEREHDGDDDAVAGNAVALRRSEVLEPTSSASHVLTPQRQSLLSVEESRCSRATMREEEAEIGDEETQEEDDGEIEDELSRSTVDTAKIKRVVAAEVQRLLGAQVSHPPSHRARLGSEAAVQSRLFQFSADNDYGDDVTAAAYRSECTSTKSGQQNPLELATAATSRNENTVVDATTPPPADFLAGILPLSVQAQLKSHGGSVVRFAGQRRQFLDAETDRISRIMLGGSRHHTAAKSVP